MVVWVNCHGGFIVGYGLLFTALIAIMWEEAKGARLFAAAVGLSLLAVCATPYGVEYVRFMAHALSMPRPAISEWGTPTLWSSAHLLFLVAIVGTVAALISQKRGAIALEGRLFLTAAAYAALTHQRLIPFFLFAACVFLPPAMPQLAEIRWSWLRSRLRAVRLALLTVSGATGLIGIGVVALFVVTLRDFSLDRSEYPVETVQWMRQHNLSGNVLVPFNQGSYVLMKGYPELRVSIDGRYEEVYTQETFETALAALSPYSPRFSEAFAELAPAFIIICQSTLPFSAASLFPGVWQPLFIQDNKECGVFGDPQRAPSAKNVVTNEPHWLLHF
jgi:hypothetical protein